MTKQDWIRVGISVVLVGSLVVGFFLGMVPVEVFVSVVSGAVGYYFSERKQEKVIEALKAAGEIKVVDDTENV